MNRVLNVLLVEDNEADIRLMQEALFDCHIQVNLKTLSDGEEAAQYLKQTANNRKTHLPDVIVLDLNMPRKDGHEFLEEMGGFLREREIPVVLLTVSDSREDLDRALNARLNYFLSKPVNGQKLGSVLKAISELWASPAHRN